MRRKWPQTHIFFLYDFKQSLDNSLISKFLDLQEKVTVWADSGTARSTLVLWDPSAFAMV